MLHRNSRTRRVLTLSLQFHQQISFSYIFCHFSTKSETNLKVKQAIDDTYSKFKSALRERNPGRINAVAWSLDFKVECEAPNEVLNEFEGTLTWRSGETVSLDNDKMLLRGCRLRNTKWCYGLVVFAGSDTKLMRNGGKAKFKQTHIDKLLNYLIIGVSCCGSC